MLKTTITRAIGRGKIKAVSVSVIAALTAVGLMREDVQQARAATVASAAKADTTGIGVKSIKPFDELLNRPVGQLANIAAAKSTAKLDLPNLDHPNVDQWVKRFTTGQRQSYAVYLERKARYEPMISKKLAEKGLPQDLIYLAMIESGFNPTAKSPVKASGLWQFMAPTAKQYGLKVTGRVDERNNPDRSTDAALKYLSALHDRFGSWYLAAAAYNTGQGRVARIMKEETGGTKGTDADYYRIAKRLPKETRDYVPKMIAAARIGREPAKYGFSTN